MIQDVSDDTFQKIVIEQSKKVTVLVNFWSYWCMPCKTLDPILESLVKAYEGKLIMVKMNVDDNPLTSEKYEITGVPTVKLFKEGKETDTFIGSLPENFIKGWLRKNMEQV